MRCNASYSCEDVRADIFAQIVPRCRKCADDDDDDDQTESQPLQLQQQKNASNAENSSSAAGPSNLKAGNSSSSATDKPDSLTIISDTKDAPTSSKPLRTPTTSASSPEKTAETSGESSSNSPENSPRSSDHRQPPTNVIKPDIVFFGESLPELFHQRMAKDKDVCDLLIVIGSSLKVRPVALIPSSISPQIPQVNRIARLQQM